MAMNNKQSEGRKPCRVRDRDGYPEKTLKSDSTQIPPTICHDF